MYAKNRSYVEHLVAIGSLNPAKTVGIKRVFASFFYNCTFAEVSTLAVAKPQPMGIEEILRGATERAKFARSKTDAELGVGVEAGLFAASPHLHINLQAAMIVDSTGKSGTGFSCGFQVPESLVERMEREGSELDTHARELTGVPKIREEDGIVYHLTKGGISRLEMTEQCVRMALVPWLNKRQYDL